MRRKLCVAGVALAAFALTMAAAATDGSVSEQPYSVPEEQPGFQLPDQESQLPYDSKAWVGTEAYTMDTIDAGPQELDRLSWLTWLRKLGFGVFTTPFNIHDGYGDGPWRDDEYPPLAPGHRPTLQGNGLTLRVNGLDSQSCNECHSLVSHATKPPTLGFGGVGGIAQNVLFQPSLIDVGNSFDLEDRIVYMAGHDPDLPLVPEDGMADYNGRYINTPFLFGGGGVELLAKEMTQELQDIFMEAVKPENWGQTTPLTAKDVNFGYVTVDHYGHIDLELIGIGPLVLPDTQDPEELRKVIFVAPFGRKGANFSMRDFDVGAMEFHFGMQPVEDPNVGNTDEDHDGVSREVSIFDMSVLHVFDVMNPRPYQEPLDYNAQIGFEVFQDIGCNSCHRPVLETDSRSVPLSYPQTAWDPYKDVRLYIDLTTTSAGFDPVPHGGAYVPLFSDLKRHDMGEGLAEDFEDFGVTRPVTIDNSEFITARLWGIADTAPYLHDGRASTLREAIEKHGGEAALVKQAFDDLSWLDKLRVIYFLKHLRTPEHPNEEL